MFCEAQSVWHGTGLRSPDASLCVAAVLPAARVAWQVFQAITPFVLMIRESSMPLRV